MRYPLRGFLLLAALFLSVISLFAPAARAQSVSAVSPPSPRKKGGEAVGFPQDAGPHDAGTVIEWWYFNAFLTTESGHHYAVVGSFFRSGLTPEKKGHYLLYALADLDAKQRTAYSILDRASINLLKSYLFLAANQHPEDPEPLRMLALLQKGTLPSPHRALASSAVLTTKPLFSLAMGPNRIAQATPDGRTWKVALRGDDFTLDLTLAQPARPPMRVGGEGKTGIDRPDDMYYLSLTHADATGTLTRGGKTERVTGLGWLDRQWGQTWGVRRSVGWDWFGLHLTDGTDLLLYRLRDTATGKTLRTLATVEAPDGTQTTEVPQITPIEGEIYRDPATKIRYPAAFTLALPQSALTLTVRPAFPDQTIPVLTGGDAIWEGVVHVTGKRRDLDPVTGDGYLELVGYTSGQGTAASSPPRRTPIP